MITATGYSKDPSIPPDGIVITWGKDMIESKGGLLSFIRYFEKIMVNVSDEDSSMWLQKCKNRPTNEDILYVYIIVCNQLKYRGIYAGYQQGDTNISNGDGRSWSSSQVISWPRILIAGPIEKAPRKIHLKGFQGFRYCTKLF